MPIEFFSEGISTPDGFESSLRDSWIHSTCESEGSELENLVIILCTDEYLLNLNQSYLKHDTYTDIITFDYGSDESASGEIYISLERIVDNAKEFNVAVLDELDRVIIHGVLHLLGYGDKSPEEKKEMTEKEDYYLSLRSFKNS